MTNSNYLVSTPVPMSTCPSCASPAANVLKLGADWWVVSCGDCGLIGPISTRQDQAIDGWNLRLALARNPDPSRKTTQNV